MVIVWVLLGVAVLLGLLALPRLVARRRLFDHGSPEAAVGEATPRRLTSLGRVVAIGLEPSSGVVTAVAAIAGRRSLVELRMFAVGERIEPEDLSVAEGYLVSLAVDLPDDVDIWSAPRDGRGAWASGRWRRHPDRRAAG